MIRNEHRRSRPRTSVRPRSTESRRRRMSAPRRRAAPLLAVEDLEVAYGEARALFGVTLDAAAGRGRRGARPQRRGQELARVRRSAASSAPAAGTIRFDGRDVTACEPHRSRPARHRLHPRGARDLPAPLGARQPPRPAPLRGPATQSARRHSSARSTSSRCSRSGAASRRARSPAASSRCSSLARVLAAPPRLLDRRRDVARARAQDGRPGVRVARRRPAPRA